MQESCENARARARMSSRFVARSMRRAENARTKRFLLQDEENGVEELEVLEIVVDNIKEF